jgi:hypothetical protein
MGLFQPYVGYSIRDGEIDLKNHINHKKLCVTLRDFAVKK